MALVGISVGETFEYVLDRDPCKKTVEVPVDPDDPSQGKRTETVIEDGATVFTLDVFVMGMIYAGARRSRAATTSGSPPGETSRTSRRCTTACAAHRPCRPHARWRAR